MAVFCTGRNSQNRELAAFYGAPSSVHCTIDFLWSPVEILLVILLKQPPIEVLEWFPLVYTAQHLCTLMFAFIFACRVQWCEWRPLWEVPVHRGLSTMWSPDTDLGGSKTQWFPALASEKQRGLSRAFCNVLVFVYALFAVTAQCLLGSMWQNIQLRKGMVCLGNVLYLRHVCSLVMYSNWWYTAVPQSTRPHFPLRCCFFSHPTAACASKMCCGLSIPCGT